MQLQNCQGGCFDECNCQNLVSIVWGVPRHCFDEWCCRWMSLLLDMCQDTLKDTHTHTCTQCNSCDMSAPFQWHVHFNIMRWIIECIYSVWWLIKYNVLVDLNIMWHCACVCCMCIYVCCMWFKYNVHIMQCVHDIVALYMCAQAFLVYIMQLCIYVCCSVHVYVFLVIKI